MTQDDLEVLAAGTEVDHYRVIRLLGRGGMGEVYLARDLRLGRAVALKLVSRIGSRSFVQQFQLEARATARLNHPNIVTIYDVGEWRSRPYLTLEYLAARTLAQASQEQRFGHEEIVRIGRAIAAALVEAHHQGVLHRDLKPANILFPKDGRLRVLDFGIAKLLVGKANDDLEVVAEPALNSTRVSVQLGPQADEVDAAVATRAEPGSPGPATRADPPQDPGRPARSELPVGPADRRSVFATSGLGVAGTPAYMAPEQWKRLDTRATDIWALGVILYELVCGRRPYLGGESVLRELVTAPEPIVAPAEFRDIPAELGNCILACLSKVPETRPSTAEVIRRLDSIGKRGRQLNGEANPFRGLMPFAEEHADLFFGRDEEIAALVERLRVEVIVPIVGPSGVGKSSLVQAGVVPRLREQGQWHLVQMRPGHQPFETLAARILDNVVGRSVWTSRNTPFATAVARDDAPGPDPMSQAQLAAQLRDHPSTLALVLGGIAEKLGARVLLFVDQLEELYTLVEAPALRAAFMTALATAADDPSEPVRVVVTLRDDFIGRVADGDRAREMLAHLTLLGTPGPDGLRDALLGPLAAVGYEFDDPDLARRMIDAIHGEPASLPLLQFTMRLLWERRDREGRRLLSSEYEAIGGVGGALAEHADRVINELSPERVQIARDLLLRLVTTEGTRRVMVHARLLDGLPPEAVGVLGRLIDSRLLVVRRGLGDQEDGRIELAHESLILVWHRFAAWLEDSREERRALGELIQAAELWERRGRREDEVWEGQALTDAERWLERAARAVPEAADAFVRAGRTRASRGQRRRRRWMLALVAGLSAVALGAVIVAGMLANRERIARVAEERAETRRAMALVESGRAAYARGDPLQARAKVRSALEIDDSVLARGLWRQLERDPIVGQRSLGSNIYDVTFSPDGRWIAAAMQSKLVYLVDALTFEARVLQGHGDQVLAIAFSTDGKTMASGAWNGELFLWDLASGSSSALATDIGEVAEIVFAADGASLHVLGRGGTLLTLPVAGGPRATIPIGAVSVSNVAPDRGGLIWTDGDGHVHWWLPASGIRREVSHAGATPTAVALGPGGRLAAWGEHTGAVRIRDAEGRELRTLVGHTGRIYALAFDHTGDRIVSLAADHTVRVWDAATGGPLGTFTYHPEVVSDLDISPDGTRIVTGGLKLVVLDPTQPERVVSRGHGQSIYGIAVSRDGAWIASGDLDGEIHVWGRDGALGCAFIGHEADVRGLAFAPDGALLASGGGDHMIRLWAMPACSPVGVLEGHEGRIHDLTFSADGTWIASGGDDDSVRVWNVATRRVHAVMQGQQRVSGVAFAPDLRSVISSGFDGSVWRWELDGHGDRILASTSRLHHVAIRGDGQEFAVASEGGGLRLYDVATATWSFARTQGRVYAVGYLPDGERVAYGGSDRAVHLLNLRTGGDGALAGHRDEINTLAVDPSGTWIVSGGDDWTVRAWNASDGSPRWHGVATQPMPTTVQIGDATLIGHRDGIVERRRDGVVSLFEETPASSVVALVAGPAATVVAGYANGTVLLWELESGKLIDRMRLHGPITQLAVRDGWLAAATELGDSGRYDLRAFERDRCQLLADVWQRIPIVWGDGVPVAQAAPSTCTP